jgi:cell division septum initiation protein DivIVA
MSGEDPELSSGEVAGGHGAMVGIDLPRRVRGYDVEAADAYIADLAARSDELERECAALRDRGARLEADLARYREREAAVSEALVAAKAHADTIVANAEREAEAILGEARTEAEQRQEERERSERERDDVERDIRRLRQIRHEVKSGLSAFLTQAVEQLQSGEPLGDLPLDFTAEAIFARDGDLDRDGLEPDSVR